MARDNRSHYALLAILTFGPMSGYEIHKLIEQSIGNYWSESFGQIYPRLKLLVSEGLAEALPADDERRTRYALTDAGWATLRQWLTLPVEPSQGRNELLLKLFVGRTVGPRINEEHVRLFRALQQADLQRFLAIESELEALGTEQATYSIITVRYGIHFARAMMAWCDETLATLASLPPTP